MIEQAIRDAAPELSSGAPAGSTVAVPEDALVGVARTRTFFPELEALRGVAVLLVFAFHVNGMGGVRALPGAHAAEQHRADWSGWRSFSVGSPRSVRSVR